MPLRPSSRKRWRGALRQAARFWLAVAEFDAAAVLAERDVPHPVEFVLDVPMLAPEWKQPTGLSSRGGETRDRVLHLHGFFAIAARDALQAADWSPARPVEMPRQARADFSMPADEASMSLLDLAGASELLLPLFLARRGKKRASTRPRELLSEWAGCLGQPRSSRLHCRSPADRSPAGRTWRHP